VLRRIFGPKREEVTEEQRKLQNEELNDLHSSLNTVQVFKSRGMRQVGNVACMWERTCACRVLVGKPEGKKPLERPRCRWEDNIKMDLQYMGWGGLNRALGNAVMKFQFPQNARNFLTS